MTTDPSASANRELFESDGLVDSYDPDAGLTPAEHVLVERWVPMGADVLDIGVGTGRTFPALAERCDTYVGIDVSSAMVAAARRRFPGARFLEADASDLSMFADGSFDTVVFSYNGLDYLHPLESRRSALAGIRRVLRPGGTFIMSTHNPRALWRSPVGDTPQTGATWLRRMAVSGLATVRATATLPRGEAFWRGSGYQTDRIQPLDTYYERPRQLVDELTAAGLEVVHCVAGDHPRPIHEWSTAWTYVAAVRPRHDALTIQVVADGAGIRSLIPEWDALHRTCGGGFFQHSSWVLAWDDCISPGGDPVVVAARTSDGRLVGVLPMARLTRNLHSRVPVPLRYFGIAGSGAGGADHLGPLAADDATGAALVRAASALEPRRSLYFENLSPRWSPIVGAQTLGRRVQATPCYASERSSSGSFRDRWSPKMRKNVRRRARRFEELGITATWTPPAAGFTGALRSLRDLHLRRWKARGEPGLFDDDKFELFVELARASTVPEGPWVLLLAEGDTPIGGLLGLRAGSTLSIYKTGWDPAYRSLAPGVALGVEAMRWSEEQGLTVVDYLRGERRHKADLGCEVTYDDSILVSRGLSGMALRRRERAGGHGVRS